MRQGGASLAGTEQPRGETSDIDAWLDTLHELALRTAAQRTAAHAPRSCERADAKFTNISNRYRNRHEPLLGSPPHSSGMEGSTHAV
jgi:hypothetical protein